MLPSTRYDSGMRIAGIVLDIYDDPEALVLRDKIAERGQQLPEKLASMRMLAENELANLPDRLFGLVAENHGQVIRKYAMHDAEHLALSMIYFDDVSHRFPDRVRQKVAANLVNACAWYDLDPPESLTKHALVGALSNAAVAGLGVMDMASKAREGAQQGRERMESFRRAQASGTKVADLVGTEAMPQSGLRTGSGRKSPTSRLDVPMKTSAMLASMISAGWEHCGDISKEEAPVIKKAAEYSHFALPHLEKYPIDTPAMIKKAVEYFDEYCMQLPLAERRVFAQSVTNRAEELNIKVAGAVLDYAGEAYGPNIMAELQTRTMWYAGTGHDEAYGLLLEKVSEISPMVMADMLREVDAASGADRAYDRLLDPYAAVYGTPKVAEESPENYSWVDATDYVSGLELLSLAKNPSGLDMAFDRAFVRSFQKDPIGIFKSMPAPEKVVIARLAADSVRT